MTSLQAAWAALKEGQHARALAHIDEAWRLNPTLALRSLAVALKPADSLGVKGGIVAKAAQAAMLEPRHPRASAALEQVLTEVPFTADSSKPSWDSVFALVRYLKDPHFIELSQTLPKKWAIRPLILSWLTNRFKRSVEEIPRSAQPHSSDELALIREIDEHLKAAKAPALLNDAELWSAVYTSPTNDAPRQVLADFLQERADPRGEFIALQLATHKTPAGTKREKSLLKQHLTEWLGPIAPVVTKASAVFARGFVVDVVARFKNEQDAKRYGGFAEWSTVEVLRHAMVQSLSQIQWSTYVPPQMTALREFESIAGASLPFLLEVEKPWPLLERGGFWRLTQSDVERLVRDGPRQMPALSSLTMSNLSAEWLSAKTWPSAWRHLTVRNDSAELAKLLTLFDSTPLERLSTSVPEKGQLHFERDSRGRLGKLSLKGSGFAAQILATLSRLQPGSLSEYTADPEHPLNTETIARLAALGAV